MGLSTTPKLKNLFNAAAQHMPSFIESLLHNPEKTPNQVVIDLHDGFEEYMGSFPAVKWNMPYAQKLEYPTEEHSGNANDIIKNMLKEYVTEHGTIDELCFTGHGLTGGMASRSFDDYFMIDRLLDDVAELEEELDQKICNRVIFNGCTTFGHLADNLITKFRDFADNHNMEIVGTTSGLMNGWGFINTARYVQFTPEGKIIRDEWDDRYAPATLLKNDSKWTKIIQEDSIKETPQSTDNKIEIEPIKPYLQ